MRPSLLRRGIVPIHGIAEAFDAAEAAAFIGEAWARPYPPLWAGSPRVASTKRRPVRWRLRAACRTPPGRGASVRSPDEADAKALLAEAGLPVPAGTARRQRRRGGAAAAALGFPVALKALGIAHKSEHGAVRLNLRDDACACARRPTRWPASAAASMSSAWWQGGVAELIVGVTRDPLFGPVMTIGSGGVLVELLKDTATLLLPATRADIEAALRGLKLFPLLDGYRGRPKADLAAADRRDRGHRRLCAAMPMRSRSSTSIR